MEDENKCKKDLYINNSKEALNMMKDSYFSELNKTYQIDNKAGVISAVIIGLFTLYIPMIPFEKIKKSFRIFSKTNVVILTIMLYSLLLSFILLMIAFYFFYKSYNVRNFKYLNLDDLIDEKYLRKSSEEMNVFFCEKYLKVIKHNFKVNNEKVMFLKKGIFLSFTSFTLISVVLVTLLCFVS